MNEQNNIVNDNYLVSLKTLLEENQRQRDLLTFDYKQNKGDITKDVTITEQTWLNWTQGILDVAGFVPGYGDALDVVNAIISFARAGVQGKWMPHGLNGVLSLVAVIPVAGSAIAVPLKLVFKYIPTAAAVKVLETMVTDGKKAADILNDAMNKVPKAKVAFSKLTSVLNKNMGNILKGTKILKSVLKKIAIVPLTKLDDKFAKYAVRLVENLEKFLVRTAKKSSSKATSNTASKLLKYTGKIPTSLLSKNGRLSASSYGIKQSTKIGKATVNTQAKVFYASQDMFRDYLIKSGSKTLKGGTQNAINKQVLKNINGPAMKKGDDITTYLNRNKGLKSKYYREFTNLTILNNPKMFNDYLKSGDAKRRFEVFIKTLSPSVVKDVRGYFKRMSILGYKMGTSVYKGASRPSGEETRQENIRNREKDIYKKQSSDKNKKGSHYGQKREM